MLSVFSRRKEVQSVPQETHQRLAVEDALRESKTQYQAANPQTDEQWRRLRTALQQQPSIVPRINFRNYSFRPAFVVSFAMVLLVTAGVFLLRNFSTKTYSTARGEHSTVILQDESEVTLNYQSELSVERSPFDRSRYVTLKGEALFQVKRNGTPFILTTEIGKVQVLGTQFNVRVRDNQMDVAVLSGSVKVIVSREGQESSIILTSGQIIVCSNKGFTAEPGLIPSSEFPGWLHGKLSFYRSPLSSVCKELESQFGITITIPSPQANQLTVTGTIDARNPESALTALAQLTGMTYRHETNTHSLY